MSAPEELRRIAAGIAVHLGHLREYRGIRYVPAAPIPHDRWPIAEPIAEPVAEPIAEPVTGHAEPAPATASPPAAEGDRRQSAAGEAPERRSLPIAADTGAAPERADDPRTWSAAKKLDYLRQRSLGDCRRCALAQGRTQIVFGVGNPEAGLMFVGEAPGFHEDRQGIPFVGRAGERLNQWLDLLGIARDNAYIANVLKCRPPNNRDPRPEEIARCSPFLQAQIRAISPRVLVALGRFAGNLLTGQSELPLHRLRSRAWTYEDPKHHQKIPLIVTYHPSYVLRQAGEQGPAESEADATVLSDLKGAVAILGA